MNRTYISDLHKNIGEEVLLSGFVDVRRDHGKLIFIDFRDRTGMVQMVVLPNNKDTHEIARALRVEWVISINGIVKERPEKMKNRTDENGDLEIEIQKISVISEAEELPFEKDSEINLDTQLNYLPFTLRNTKSRAIFRVQAHIIQAFRDFLIGDDFVEIQVPKITGGDAEGGAAAFEVDYFGNRAFLATSPQLYKQILVPVFEKVFCTGNIYRAEKHSTTRHINEYTSLDLEMGFIKDHTDIMELETRFLLFLFEKLKNYCKKEFEILKTEFPKLPPKIPSLKLREVQDIIKKETGEDFTKEPDLDPAQERWLSEYAKKKYSSDFIFVTHYPIKKRPFYTMEDAEDIGFTKSFDLIFKGVEITTGGQRIHNYKKLSAKISERGLDLDRFAFYLQAFKYGMPPEGGLAIGLERLTARLLGLPNIKEATLFPRDINRIDTLLSDVA